MTEQFGVAVIMIQTTYCTDLKERSFRPTPYLLTSDVMLDHDTSLLPEQHIIITY